MNNNIIYYVYELIDPKNNLPFYIGKGKNDRMYSHISEVKQNKIPNGNNKLYSKIKSILNYGFNDVTYNKIFESQDEKLILQLEKFIISEYKFFKINLCNMTDGGEGHSCSPWNKGLTKNNTIIRAYLEKINYKEIAQKKYRKKTF